MSDSDQDPNEPDVVRLPSAGVPADHGLSSLGMLLQLAGSVMAAAVALFTFLSLFTLGGAARTGAAWMFLILALCITRSMFHRMAGTELLYGPPPALDGKPRSPLGGVRRYIVVALAHTVVVAAIFKLALGMSTKMTAGLALGLAVWPLVLAALLPTSIFQRFRAGVPIAEDKGFEGASILMTILGIAGGLTTVLVLFAVFEAGGRHVLREGRMILVVLGLVMLAVRSGMHVQAGVSGLRVTSLDRSVERANRYASFGVITAFCVGGALLLAVMTTAPHLFGIVLVAALCWMLMAWPLIVRRFFGDRQFADLLAGEHAAVHRRAPDAGLAGLGWLLLGHAVLGASFAIPELLGATALTHELDVMFHLFGSSGLHSPWWNVGVMMLQAWAGYELIRMTPHHRVIATLYAAVSSLVTIYQFWPMLRLARLSHGSPTDQAMLYMPVAIALVIPVATLVLVNRKIAPAARARFRPRPPAAPRP